MEKIRKYENSTIATSTRRLAALSIDALVLCVVSFLLMLLCMTIVSNMGSYKKNSTTLKQEMNICYRIEEEAHLYEFQGEGDEKYSHPRRLEDIFEDYCLEHILLAYEKDPVPFENYDIEIENENNLPLASYETDNLAYFFVHYVPQYNNYNGTNNDIVSIDKDPRLFFMESYKKAAVKTDMWIFDEYNYDFPYLDSEFAADLYRYLFLDSSYQTGLTNYNYLAKNYMNLWNEEADLLIKSSRFNEHYQVYKQCYANCAYHIIVGVVIVYLISFVGTIVVPQFIFKNGKTIGKKVVKISVIDFGGYEMQPYQFILRNIFLFFALFPLMMVTCFLTGGSSSGWMYPIVEIKNVGFSLFTIMIILGIISLISFIIMAVTSTKRSIHDFILNTACIDDRYNMTSEEVLALKKEEEQKTADAEKTAIKVELLDSTTFNNTEKDKTKND